MNNKPIIKTLCLGLAVTAVSLFSACKKYDNPPPVFEEYGAIASKGNRKVLVISIDGLAGADLQKINPTQLSGMMKNGKYSFDVFTELNGGKIATWVSLMAGVGTPKHQVTTDSFRPTPDADEHQAPLTYPTFLYRILETRPELETATITADPTLNRYFTEATRPILTKDDESVKDSIISVLQSPNPTVVLANFMGVEKSGLKDGYSADVPAYQEAVSKVDGYVGAVMDALKKRKNYSTEEWLVVVTTNRGGSEVSPKPGFVIYYNPLLKEARFGKDGFNAINFNGNVKAVLDADKGLFDPGSNKDFTVQFQANFKTDVIYPEFIRKGNPISGDATTGWLVIQNGAKQWALVFGGKENGGSGKQQIIGAAVATTGWHTISFTVKTVGITRMAYIYTDGLPNGSVNITSTKDLTILKQPLQVGGVNADFYMSDLEYFNIALDPAVIKANVALKDITKHPNYANLIGYWPMDEGASKQLYNRASSKYHFTVTGGPNWSAMGNDIPVNRDPKVLGGVNTAQVPIIADISMQIMYWLKIPRKATWGNDGLGWLSKYEVEFLK